VTKNGQDSINVEQKTCMEIIFLILMSAMLRRG